jgi:hypothetical protein
MDDFAKIRIGLNGYFIDYGGGTVTDTRTGLMWMRASEGQCWEDGKVIGKAERFSFEESITIQKKYAGHCDWRTPSLKELVTIVDKTRNAPFMDLDVFPNTHNDRYRSSTPHQYSTHLAYSVDFSFGSEDRCGRIGGLYLRLVRGNIQPSKLTISTTGNGTGHVECNPALPTYEFGSKVTLLARASANSIFMGWQGDIICNRLYWKPIVPYLKY